MSHNSPEPPPPPSILKDREKPFFRRGNLPLIGGGIMLAIIVVMFVAVLFVGANAGDPIQARLRARGYAVVSSQTRDVGGEVKKLEKKTTNARFELQMQPKHYTLVALADAESLQSTVNRDQMWESLRKDVAVLVEDEDDTFSSARNDLHYPGLERVFQVGSARTKYAWVIEITAYAVPEPGGTDAGETALAKVEMKLDRD